MSYQEVPDTQEGVLNAIAVHLTAVEELAKHVKDDGLRQELLGATQRGSQVNLRTQVEEEAQVQGSWMRYR